MRGSGVDAAVSESKAEGGECKGRFSRVVKWSCNLTITEALSDSSVPSVAINGVDTSKIVKTQMPEYVHPHILEQ